MNARARILVTNPATTDQVPFIAAAAVGTRYQGMEKLAQVCLFRTAMHSLCPLGFNKLLCCKTVTDEQNSTQKNIILIVKL